MANTGVFPVFDNVFKVGKAGRSSEAADMVTVAEMESFSVSIDGNVEEWKPMEAEGWTKRMTTGKALTISLSGKLCPSDPGNAYIAEMEAVINVTAIGGGDSTNVAVLEFDVMSHGKPTYTPASA